MTSPVPPPQAHPHHESMPDENEQRRNMLAGELYLAFDPQLTEERIQVKQLCFELNQTPPSDTARRAHLTRQILCLHDPQDNAVGSNTATTTDDAASTAWVESPFYVDYGYNLTVGNNFYANHGCTILDCNRIIIGDNCLLGPHVCITAATHPLSAQLRLQQEELAKPITIGNNVWISANATICPGVTLGDNVVVGAGAVVTKSFPTNVVVAGVPAKVIKHIPNTADTSL